MRRTLTDAGVRALKPRPKRYAFADPEVRGHWIRVMPSGVKTYATVARNPDGRQIWTTIGPADAMTIARARERAREILERVRAGLPAIVSEGETFGAIAASWIARHVDQNGLRSHREIKRFLAVHILPAWNDRPFTSIRRSDIAALLDRVQDNHSGRQADLVLAVIASITSWAATRRDDYNPPTIRGMKRGKPTARSRVLNDDEIRAVWRAAEDAGTFGAFLQMCLLTGQRSRKVASMRWEHIEAGVWTVPREAREKDTGGQLAVSGAALAILERMPRLASNPHVFAGRGDGPLSSFSDRKAAFDRLLPADMPGWVLHDLRRTARSLMSRASVQTEISERVLGHVQGGIQATYDRYTYATEKRDALARLAALIDGIVNPPEPNIVPIRRAQ
jgi:integrase